MNLRARMAGQELRHLWSLRWVIVSAGCSAAATLYVSLPGSWLDALPHGLGSVFGWGALASAGAAAVAKAVHPKGIALRGGAVVVDLPLGRAVAPPGWGAASPLPDTSVATEAPPAPAPVDRGGVHAPGP